jgi:hypothetical protein
VWLIFLIFPYGRAAADTLSGKVPAWLAIANWCVSILLIAVCGGPIEIRALFLIPLYAFLVLSLMLLAVLLHSHLFISLFILCLAGVEMYWLIPKWEANRKRHDGLG